MMDLYACRLHPFQEVTMTKSTQSPQAPQNGVVEPDKAAQQQPAPETPSTARPDQTPRPEDHGRPSDDSDPGHS